MYYDYLKYVKGDIYRYMQIKTKFYYHNDDSYQTYLTKNTLESICIYTLQF